MRKQDYVAIVALGLLFTIIIASQFGLFSSNLKQESIQEQLKGLGTLILTKVNQTAFMIHEDTEREKQNAFNIAIAKNQSIFEQEGRDKQTEIQVKEIQTGVTKINHTVNDLFIRYNNTTEKMFKQIDNILSNMDYAVQQNTNISNQNYHIAKEGKQLAKDHDKIQGNLINTTKEIDRQVDLIYKLLYEFGTENQKILINNFKLNNDTNRVINFHNDTMTELINHWKNQSNYIEDED